MAKLKSASKSIEDSGDTRTGEHSIGMTDLLSFRLHSVANLLSRSAAMRYKRDFGVTLWEWRTIGLIGGQPGILFKDLAKSAGLDKAQASRVVAGLSERGLLLRSSDENDGRGLRLSLTNTGKRLYESLIEVANERNDAFLHALETQERKALEAALVKLERLGRAFIEQERSLGDKE